MSVELDELEEINRRFENTKEEPDKWDSMYCSALLINARQNSGSRIIMSSGFQEQFLIPFTPDFPHIYTGYENAFGRYADSITKSERNYKIKAVISKFPTMPRHIYYYVVQDILTGVYDIIEMTHYESYAESHGYVKPQTKGDMYMPDMIIPEGEILASAPSRDKHGNYCTGVNAKVAYVSWMDNEEDGYVMSDEFAAKTKYVQIEEYTTTINKNTVMLNKYGTDEDYKAFPDIGEDVEGGVVYINRQINYSFAASETTRSSLKRVLDSDIVMHGKGRIIDIDVFINDEEELKNNACRVQLMKYWVISKMFHQRIVDELGKIVANKSNKYTYALQMLYERSKDFLNPNIQFSSNNGVFEFGYINLKTTYESQLREGSKITDRAASKGVVCHILPKAMMPRDKWGNVADICQSPPGVVGRANSDQIYEHEKNYISFHIRMKMAEANKHGVEKQFAILYDYMEYIDKVQADTMRLAFDSLPEISKIEYIADIITNGIYIRQGPTNNMTYEQICYLYDKYKIKPGRVRVQREIKKHGFNRSLLTNNTDSMYSILKNSKDEIINKLTTPYNVDNNKEENKALYGDNNYAYTNEFTLPDEGENTRVVSLEDDNVKQLGLIKRKTLEELLDDTWTDETYIVDESEDTITLSFLTQDPVIIASKFYLILEHVPEKKLSARFVGSTNPLGLPNKSGKSETSGNGAYGSSPIKYGEMEVNNALIRIKPSIVFRLLSQVSTNPKLRNDLCYSLLYNDPLRLHNLSTPISDKCDNIPAKEFNAYLFCLGLEVLNDNSEDIYSAFDDREYSDSELEKIFELHSKKHPPSKFSL
ncbi:MAG: hypothetical protein ACRC5M_04445 [Anaeroplasmataceae bacterium]